MIINKQTTLLLAWLIVIIAVAGTLYGSEVIGLPICHLCWYQRICLYPLVIILGIGAFNNDSSCIRYATPLAGLGALFALYQYLEQMIPNFAPINVCGSGSNCSQIHMKLFGFVTLPLLSFIGSLAIILLLFMARGRSE